MIVTSLKYQKKGFRQKIPKLKKMDSWQRRTRFWSILIDFDLIYSNWFQLNPTWSKKSWIMEEWERKTRKSERRRQRSISSNKYRQASNESQYSMHSVCNFIFFRQGIFRKFEVLKQLLKVRANEFYFKIHLLKHFLEPKF